LAFTAFKRAFDLPTTVATYAHGEVFQILKLIFSAVLLGEWDPGVIVLLVNAGNVH